MSPVRVPAVLPLVGLLLTLSGCGGDGGSGDTPPTLGTLAYVETECRDTWNGFVEHQALRIRQGDREPVTVFETPGVGPIAGIGGLCAQWTVGRVGATSIYREAFQWVAVSPDGTGVVFEVTDEFSAFPPLPLNLPPEQEGIFWVRADGTGLRRLGEPSRQRTFFITSSGADSQWPGVYFSPSGRTIAFIDKVPDADGYEADQVVTIDVATGTRMQVTQLPPTVPPPPFSPAVPTANIAPFVDERTISFSSFANPNGANPAGAWLLMTITTDTRELDVPLPILIAVPGGRDHAAIRHHRGPASGSSVRRAGQAGRFSREDDIHGGLRV
jgi:hypothetical protein